MRKLDNIPTNIILIDKNKKIVDVNNSASLSYGFKKEQVIGKPLKDLISEDNQEYILELLQASLNKDSTYEFTTDFIVGDTSIHTLFHIKSEGDHIIACLTPKLPSKDDFIEMYWKQSFLKPILESSKDGILLIDGELNIRHFNNNACDLIIRLTQNEKIFNGKENKKYKIKDILKSSEYSAFFKAFSKTPQTSQELFSKTYKRNSQHINFHLRPIWSDDLGFMGYSLTLKDVSPEIKAAKNLIDNTENLLRLSQLAETSQLTNGILHNTGNALSHLFVSLSEIEKIIECSGLKDHKRVVDKLKNSKTTPELIKNLPEIFIELEKIYSVEHTDIYIQLNRLKGVCEGIQNIIESQQNFATYSDSLEKISLIDFLDDVFTVENIGLQRHSVKISKLYSLDKNINVHAQKNHLFHILLNLIKNSKDALNANPINERELSINIKDDESYVYIEISDNGEGIKPEDLSKIFSYGYTTKPTGHGFGLSTCKKYLEEMNGDITVKSNGPNQGASFTIKLIKYINNKKVA